MLLLYVRSRGSIVRDRDGVRSVVGPHTLSGVSSKYGVVVTFDLFKKGAIWIPIFFFNTRFPLSILKLSSWPFFYFSFTLESAGARLGRSVRRKEVTKTTPLDAHPRKVSSDAQALAPVLNVWSGLTPVPVFKRYAFSSEQIIPQDSRHEFTRDCPPPRPLPHFVF